MHAYEVSTVDGTTCFVMADTPDEAIATAIQCDETREIVESGRNELTVLRRPELDGGITEAALHDIGRISSDCAGCHRPIEQGVWYDEDDGEEYEAFAGPNGRLFCSEACYLANADLDRVLDRPGICLYEEWWL